MPAMSTKAIKFVIAALFASVASGQTPAEQSLDRVFYFTHTETVQDLQEIATLIRTMADIRQIMTYAAPRALALRGTAGQIALAEWLIKELDKPANQSLAQQGQDPATYEYWASGSSDNAVRVFYLTHADTAQRL